MTVRAAAAVYSSSPALTNLQAYLNRGIEPWPPTPAALCGLRGCTEPITEPGLWIARGADHCSSKCARYADGS